MRRLVTMAALLSFCALLWTSISPASAAHEENFKDVYNRVNNTYIATQSLAGAHNTYVKRHHSRCTAGQKRKWVVAARADINRVLAVEKRLAGVASRRRKQKIYHDLVQTVHDFERWGTSQLMPHVAKCKAMTDGNYTVENDLYNVACDLNLCHY